MGEPSVEGIPYWYWLVLGGVLGVLEAAVPGFVLIWLGLAAAAVGLAVWLWPGMYVTWQILMFACLSVGSVMIWMRVAKPTEPEDDGLHLNRRAESYVGRSAVVVDPIILGHGRVKIADGTWSASGPDAARGSQVKIIGVDGTTLKVRPLAGDRQEVTNDHEH
jgi:membrane protein implicated in regulation of membrane protease activity